MRSVPVPVTDCHPGARRLLQRVRGPLRRQRPQLGREGEEMGGEREGEGRGGEEEEEVE